MIKHFKLYGIISMAITYSWYYWYTHLYLVPIIRANLAPRYAIAHMEYINSSAHYLFYPFWDGGIICNVSSLIYLASVVSIPFLVMYIIIMIYRHIQPKDDIT